MITVEQLRNDRPEVMTVDLARTIHALVATARRALEADRAEHSLCENTRITLELAEDLAGLLLEGCEVNES
ncbi:hypothetical protein [Thalassovita sp.]|uniref:hypothetical protein n=1 Tax=Thalassovita sp. TaxID=1979401 RepID=UPI0029DE8336|nr:hypothetical protein [Thalassovita sp.]